MYRAHCQDCLISVAVLFQGFDTFGGCQSIPCVNSHYNSQDFEFWCPLRVLESRRTEVLKLEDT